MLCSKAQLASHGSCPQTQIHCPLKTEMSGCFVGRVPARHWAWARSVAAPTGTGQNRQEHAHRFIALVNQGVSCALPVAYF